MWRSEGCLLDTVRILPFDDRTGRRKWKLGCVSAQIDRHINETTSHRVRDGVRDIAKASSLRWR